MEYMEPADALRLENRAKIYEYIEMHPGTHFRELQRACGVPLSTLEYHLYCLERARLITFHRDPHNTRYYVNGSGIRVEERSQFSFLRRHKEVVRAVLSHGRIRNKELALELNKAPSTVYHHTNKLVIAGVLVREVIGRDSYFSVKDSEWAKVALEKMEPQSQKPSSAIMPR